MSGVQKAQPLGRPLDGGVGRHVRYVGLVPGEYLSGPKRRQGRITKAGNCAARRMWVEVAWHCQRSPRVSSIIAARQDELPKPYQPYERWS
jgi:transposase